MATKMKQKPEKKTKAIVPSGSDGQSHVVRTALLEIAKTNDGILTPDKVVEFARDPESELHDYFEWDDSSAADGYRLIQAAGLIRRVRLTICREDRSGRVVDLAITRQFEVPVRRPHTDGGYQPIENILSVPTKRASLLKQALSEFQALKKRYEKLTELLPIFKALDSIS